MKFLARTPAGIVVELTSVLGERVEGVLAGGGAGDVVRLHLQMVLRGGQQPRHREPPLWL